jgi:hypothetical protein
VPIGGAAAGDRDANGTGLTLPSAID